MISSCGKQLQIYVKSFKCRAANRNLLLVVKTEILKSACCMLCLFVTPHQDAYLEPSRTSKMELSFAKIALSIFAKKYIVDVRLDSK